MSFIEELKRRNVFKVGIAYAVSTWILLQLTDVIAEILQLPEWAPKLILLILVIGFVPALIFAWAFEMTPEGLKKEKDVDRSQSITPKTGRNLDYAIIGLLVAGLGYFIWEARFKDTPVIPEATVIPAKAGTSATSAESNAGDASTTNSKSIAVLPFTNRSPNADDIYFTDGVHDNLLTQLAKLGAFSVISRTSVMEYRDTAKNLKQIARELGVANVMEGAVQRSGDRVRINVQLIDASTDEHLWAEVYDRQLTTENLFDIQSEIAQAIATALHATLTDDEIATVSNAPTNNVAAYELYLQGKRFALGETEIGFDTAIDLYQEAVSLDPDFALAWIGLAQAYITNYWTYGGDPADREKALEAIVKAETINADFPELYMARGFYNYWGLLDYQTAITWLDKAIAQMPGNAEAHMWRGWASRRAGLWDQAVSSMRQSLKLNPRVAINWLEYGQTLSYLGRYDEAVEAATRSYDLDPDDYWGKTSLALQVMVSSGDIERALILVIGAQHTKEEGFLASYRDVQLLARHFDKALKTYESWPPEIEIQRSYIDLVEQMRADTLMMMGRVDDAGQQATLALARLDEYKKGGLDDYRLIAAQLKAHAILGDKQKISELAEQYLLARPADMIEEFGFQFLLATSQAYAGMNAESIATLDQLLSGPNGISVPYLELHPAFDSVRKEPAYAAMLENHQ